MNAIRLLALGSDTHCGSSLGLMPPDFISAEGNPIGQNPVQEWFWKCWIDAHVWLAEKTGNDPYAQVWNGDLTEGVHHGAKQLISNQLQDHIDPAVALLSQYPVRRATKTYVVKGTECHTGDLEEVVAKNIGAEKNPATGKHTFDILRMKMCGIPISIRHHFPATSRSYLEASQHSIQMGNAIIEAHRNHSEIPRILVGSHRHRPGHFSDGESLTVVTPAWQALTRHGYKVVPDGNANPGLYLLDWRNKPDGELPEVHSILFKAPQPAYVQL